MKKMICMMLALVLVLSLAACGKDEGQETVPAAQTDASVQPTARETEAPETTAPVQEKGTESWKVIGSDVYFDYPEELAYREDTGTVLFYNSDTHLVGMCFRGEKEVDSLENVIPLLDKNLARNAAGLSRGHLDGSEIVVESTESAEVCGVPALHFEGYMPNKDWKSHVAGYAFVLDDVNMMVVSLVSAKDQNPEFIEEADAWMEQMVKSVRIGE